MDSNLDSGEACVTINACLFNGKTKNFYLFNKGIERSCISFEETEIDEVPWRKRKRLPKVIS